MATRLFLCSHTADGVLLHQFLQRIRCWWRVIQVHIHRWGCDDTFLCWSIKWIDFEQIQRDTDDEDDGDDSDNTCHRCSIGVSTMHIAFDNGFHRGEGEENRLLRLCFDFHMVACAGETAVITHRLTAVTTVHLVRMRARFLAWFGVHT